MQRINNGQCIKIRSGTEKRKEQKAMKKELKYLAAGVVIGALCTGGAVLAKTAVEYIEVS